MLHAFLAQNPNFIIRVSLSMLHYAVPEELKKLFPRYEPQSNRQGLRGSEGKHFPSAIYLQSL